MMQKIGDWFDRLFNQHMFVRRMSVVWAICLITWATVTALSMEEVNEHVASIVKTISLLLTPVIALYKWRE